MFSVFWIGDRGVEKVEFTDWGVMRQWVEHKHPKWAKSAKVLDEFGTLIDWYNY